MYKITRRYDLFLSVISKINIKYKTIEQSNKKSSYQDIVNGDKNIYQSKRPKPFCKVPGLTKRHFIKNQNNK